MKDTASPGGRTYTKIRFGGRNWELGIGASITFGRADDSDIVISRGQPDLVVSRKAGKLTAVPDGLLVSNESSSRSLYLQGIPGPELEIKPQMTLGTMPFRRCRVVVLGSHGARYVLNIVCQAEAEGPPSGPALRQAAVPDAAATRGYQRLKLPPAQRRYLAALCEPVLTRIGASAVGATYARIAERCGVSSSTVRNSLGALRQKLSAEYGIPGLAHDGRPDADGPGGVSFLAPLAAWATASGNITSDDLESLDS
jgi:hypothetical protein